MRRRDLLHTALGGIAVAAQGAMDRRIGAYVGRIPKGAKRGDRPVLQPALFDGVTRLKAAKALGLTIPKSIWLRADRVIERSQRSVGRDHIRQR